MLYLRPLTKWIQNELEFREAVPELSIFKMPFAVLTSAAVVSNNIAYDENLGFKGTGPTSYKGCIIGNIINSDLNYGKDIVSNNTENRGIIGFDFDGKPIYTIGETNLRRPAPIIERIEINTDGENNALKEAQITIKCFSLKQLEMFELFYCRPGLNLLLEFGNNFELTGKQLEQYKEVLKIKKARNTETLDIISNRKGQSYKDMTINGILVQKKDYKTYIEKDYLKYSLMTEDEDEEYIAKVIKSNGQYDAFAGKVTGFSYTVSEDGVYDVQLEISAGNTVSLAIPIANVSNASKIGLKGPDGKKLSNEEITLKAMQTDFKLPQLSVPTDFLKKHVFNFIKPNDTKKEQSVSEKRYISLHFIIEYLVNYITASSSLDKKVYNVNIKNIKQGGQDTPTILCASHKKIISSSEDVIFPGNLPVIRVGGKPKTDSLYLDDKKTIDATINGLSFNITKDISLDTIDYNAESVSKKKTSYSNNADFTFGNALNIFIDYDLVVEHWNKSTFRADFLASVLGTINDNSYNLFNLIAAPNTPNGGQLMIIDSYFRKLSDDVLDSINNDKLYRFKPTTINSIVKAFNFEMDLGQLIAGQTVFQTTSAVEDILNKKAKDGADTAKKALEDNIKNNALYTNYKNGDGYYSADGIEVTLIKNSLKKEESNQFTDPKEEDTEKKKTSTEKEPSDTEVIDEKVIKFKNGTKNSILIFNDAGTILKSMKITSQKDEGTLSDFNVTIVIDGMSGFSCGELFRVSGIPEIYNQTGAFQIMNVKHSIEANGWDTTIEASWRIIRK